MRNLTTLAVLVVWACGLSSGGPASAMDIKGTISSTLTITENSQLTGNVTCTAAGASCIKFGADNITLKLNGFSITGLADPAKGCGAISDTTTSGENGIDTAGQIGRAHV